LLRKKIPLQKRFKFTLNSTFSW